MKPVEVEDLQASVRDKLGFTRLEHFLDVTLAYLDVRSRHNHTRIVSPSEANYVFYQYGAEHANRITRPLNANLFVEDPRGFSSLFQTFLSFLDDLKADPDQAPARKAYRPFLARGGLNSVVYTAQQAVGCIGDSFPDANQTRKRIGQVFENLVRLSIGRAGFKCEPRTIRMPIPGYPTQKMSYELDLVLSKSAAVVTKPQHLIGTHELVGSVKTTSKDRLDKVFLDKYFLTKLLGREVPVVAIFLHDVQRAAKGNSIFGVNSTFKTNHFLFYTTSLSKLDGVYYVDPRPVMLANPRLRQQIGDFQHFVTKDLWDLANHD